MTAGDDFLIFGQKIREMKASDDFLVFCQKTCEMKAVDFSTLDYLDAVFKRIFSQMFKIDFINIISRSPKNSMSSRFWPHRWRLLQSLQRANGMDRGQKDVWGRRVPFSLLSKSRRSQGFDPLCPTCSTSPHSLRILDGGQWHWQRKFLGLVQFEAGQRTRSGFWLDWPAFPFGGRKLLDLEHYNHQSATRHDQWRMAFRLVL